MTQGKQYGDLGALFDAEEKRAMSELRAKDAAEKARFDALSPEQQAAELAAKKVKLEAMAAEWERAAAATDDDDYEDSDDEEDEDDDQELA